MVLKWLVQVLEIIVLRSGVKLLRFNYKLKMLEVFISFMWNILVKYVMKFVDNLIVFIFFSVLFFLYYIIMIIYFMN